MTQPTVFISYSHKDEAEKKALVSHLGVLASEGMVDVWVDDRIGGGDDWEQEINQMMAKAKVAILIITVNFLTSDFIGRKEIPRLLKRRQNEGLVVLPVIAKACAWETVDWLRQMNVRPKNGRPVWSDRGSHVDEDLADIVREVAEIFYTKKTNHVSSTQPATSDYSHRKPHANKVRDTPPFQKLLNIFHNTRWQIFGVVIFIAILSWLAIYPRAFIAPIASPRSTVTIASIDSTPTNPPTNTPPFTVTPSTTPTTKAPSTPTPIPTRTPTPEPSPTEKPIQPTPTEQILLTSPTVAVSLTVPFGYGIQADPRGNTTANIGLIQGMGFTWVKFQMAWKDVEPSSGTFNWSRWDDVLGAYSANGIQVLLSIPKAPDWARPPDDDKLVEGPPQDPNTYANFVGQVAARYVGKVQAIEVWNEQNLYYEAGGQGRIDPAAYTKLLTLSYTAIKSVNPDMIVVAGALTPTGAPPPVALDDLEYLRQMYANGAKDHFDALGAHPPGFANPPDALYQGGDYDPSRSYDDHRSFFFRNTMEEYRQIMVENGDGHKAIWATEIGWPVWRFTGDPRFVFAQENSEAEQAEYTVRAYEMAREWGWVGAVFLWNLDYNITAANTELANFGIAGTSTYNALANMPK